MNYEKLTYSDKKGLNQFGYKNLQFQTFFTGEKGGISEARFTVVSSDKKISKKELEKLATDFHIPCGDFSDKNKKPEVYEFDGYQSKKYYEYVFRYSPSTE